MDIRAGSRRQHRLCESFKSPATFFVSSGFIGLSKVEEEIFVRSRLKTDCQTTGGLTEDDVRRLAEEGFTIGGHTFTHVNLAEMSNRAEMLRESRAR